MLILYANTGPEYTGTRPPGACVGVDINQTVVEQAVFTVGCSGVNLTDVLTTSPPGMNMFILLVISQCKYSLIGMARGPITQSTTNPLEYTMTMTWTPPASAWGTYFSSTFHMNKYPPSSTHIIVQSARERTLGKHYLMELKCLGYLYD